MNTLEPSIERPRDPVRGGRIALAAILYLAAFGGLPALFATSSEAYKFHGPSMWPAIPDGTRLQVDRSAYGFTIRPVPRVYRAYATPRVGDVVIVESPMDGAILVKRVLAVPGDRVGVRAGRLVRNGEFVTPATMTRCPSEHEWGSVCRRERIGERTWLVAMAADYTRDVEERVVAPGFVYVLGDHRDHSNDSASFGPVKTSAVFARVAIRYFSGSGFELARIR